MKPTFKINSADFNKAASIAELARAKNSVLPSIENLLVRITKESQTIDSTNLVIYIKAPLKNVNIISGTEILFLMPIEVIRSLKNLPPQELTFTIQEDGNLILVNSPDLKLEFRPNGWQDFPTETNLIPEKKSRIIVFPDAATIITPLMAFVSTDELRPTMTTVCIDMRTEGEITAVATDAHKLMEVKLYNITGTELNGHTMIPAPVCNIIAKLKPQSMTLTGDTTENKVMLTLTYPDRVIQVYYRTLDTEFKYPEYKSVFPTEPIATRITVDRKEFIKIIDVVEPISNRTTNQMILKTTKGILNSIEVRTSDLDNEYNINIQMKSHNDPDCNFAIAMNARFIRQILKSIRPNTVTFEFRSANKAIVINNDTYRILLMPIALNYEPS